MLVHYLVGVSFPFCVLFALAFAVALRDVIGEMTADFPTFLTDLLRLEPIVLANNANWPRRAPAVLSAVNIFCCCTDRLFTCELFNCHECTPWRDTFNLLLGWLLAFWTDDNDGSIMIGDGLLSILINFNPLKCSTVLIELSTASRKLGFNLNFPHPAMVSVRCYWLC